MPQEPGSPYPPPEATYRRRQPTWADVRREICYGVRIVGDLPNLVAQGVNNRFLTHFTPGQCRAIFEEERKR